MSDDPPVAVIGESDGRWRTSTLCLAADFGSRDDPAGQGGAAHMLEHLLMSAPLDGGPSLSERIERLGGQANAVTGLDQMFFQAQVLSAHVPEVVGLLTRAVLEPRLDDQVLDTERQAVLQELAAADADPSDTVQDAFLAAVFPEHPLGRPVGGTVQDIDGLTLTDVLAVHREVLLRRRMALVCTGGTGPIEAAKHLAAPETETETKSKTATPTAPLAELTPGPWRPHEGGSGEFSWFATGGRAPSMSDPRRHAYNILAHLLGPSPSSLLYRRLRGREGLVYAFFAWSRHYTEAGAWRIMAGVEHHNLGRAQEVVRELLLEVAGHGPEPEDLAVARRQAVMELVTGAERPWDHAMTLGRETALGTRPWNVEEGIRALEAVSAEEVRSAAAAIADRQITVVRPTGEPG
ncbi:insulinase family protein [Streptomyces cinnabarinus]|uniref:Insulinase family protein n=1 Tax=Streptomyces cinnabarinus TaxID=67287 RepID=A0ABY7KQT1_9ACTN|nr:pitrilysin family protein [Streptomyces cinnabarinus]WAZ25061.1 insulinase family protein [Streptomyces cinnabarinus]